MGEERKYVFAVTLGELTLLSCDSKDLFRCTCCTHIVEELHIRTSHVSPSVSLSLSHTESAVHI